MEKISCAPPPSDSDHQDYDMLDPNLKFHLPRLHPGRESSHTPASDHCSYDSQRVSALFETFPSRTQQTHRQHPIFGLYKQIEFQVKSPISYNCFFSCFFFFPFFLFFKNDSPGFCFSRWNFLHFLSIQQKKRRIAELKSC